jgi:hypothetical protein
LQFGKQFSVYFVDIQRHIRMVVPSNGK